ncbi:MAG TPA: nitrate- and nitrite sensing domain-containing protein [Acidimicrobiales bacterium]|nr:nitrate- and nitrite sensing domain-containing protein [Acidimicrobiales bacterium]
MARRIFIRRKLAAALAIPIAALLVVAALEVMQSTREADEVEEQVDLATATIGPSGVINSLQNERNYASLWLLGFETAVEVPVESFAEAKQVTDDAIASFRADVERKGGDVAETYGPALEALDGLGELRQQVDTYEGERDIFNVDASDPNFQGYTDILTRLFDANTQVAPAIDDPILRRGVELSDISTRQTDLIARTIRSLLMPAVEGTGNQLLDAPEEIAETSGLFGQVLTNRTQVASLGTGVYQAATDRVIEESDATGFIPIVQQTLDEAPGPVPIVDILDTVDIDQNTSYYGFRQRVEDIIVDRGDDLTAAANRTRMWFFVLAGVAVAVAVGVTWLVSRSITRPLRSLTGQAKNMADHRLPEAVLDILDTPLGEDVQVPQVEPIAVQTRDEVSDVAEALNTVQDSALDLAVEQAVLRRNIADSFVNLGRRNQNLLGRQLDFITELETNETNPDTLANLFRLDHLATRMRRNAESLLVLAGIEPPRKWAAPVRLTDVIRAALGEVEDYQRVTVRGVEPATIVGAAAADLAHLLAELIENALVFSPPDQTVDIRGRGRPQGYTLAIIDSGLGMPPADIEAANRRLAGEESFTVAPSKYLGHYVAGNLAARHGIAVHLDNSPGNGVTATVSLPRTLLTTDAAIDEQPPARASQSSRALAPAPEPSGAAEAAIGAGAGWSSNGTAGNGAGSRTSVFPTAFPTVPNDAIGPAPGPVPAPPPPPPVARTASGLVKRARRGAHDGEAGPTPMPAGDLLASLSNVAGNLAGRGLAPPQPPRTPAPPPPPPPRQAGRNHPEHDRTATSGTGGPPPPGPAAPRTPGGLTRRVRGAQLPPTEPLSLRRSPEPIPEPPRVGGDIGGDVGDARGGPGGYGHGPGLRPRGDTNGNGQNGHTDPRHDDSSARDVYSFLTSFTAGVQRGLDEAKRHPHDPEESG